MMFTFFNKKYLLLNCVVYRLTMIFLIPSNGLIFLRCLGAVVRRCSSKQVFLKFSKISQENTCVGVFFNKVTGLQTCNFLKKRLQYRCFRVKFPKFLITSFFIEHLRWLLLGTGIHYNTKFSERSVDLWGQESYMEGPIFVVSQHLKN